MISTIEYYNEKAKKYINGTLSMNDMTNQDFFLSYVKKGGTILDFGCGSGRDSLLFQQHGFLPVPCDGAENVAKIASDVLKMPVKTMDFMDLNDIETYDGIFANASIMHLEFDKLPIVFQKMFQALKADGILYVSFKYGDNDGYLGKRYYTYMTETRFSELIKPFKELVVIMQGTYTINVPVVGEIKWFHAILKKI